MYFNKAKQVLEFKSSDESEKTVIYKLLDIAPFDIQRTRVSCGCITAKVINDELHVTTTALKAAESDGIAEVNKTGKPFSTNLTITVVFDDGLPDYKINKFKQQLPISKLKEVLNLTVVVTK